MPAIGSAGSTNINVLQSDVFTFRNNDYVVTRNGAFFGGAVQVAASARYAAVQLWNPSGSDVTVIVDDIIVSTPTSAAIHLLTGSTELDTQALAGQSKLSSGAAGGAVVKTEDTTAGYLGTEWYFDVVGRQPFLIPSAYPFVLEEGAGLALWCGTVNQNIGASFAWREV